MLFSKPKKSEKTHSVFRKAKITKKKQNKPFGFLKSKKSQDKDKDKDNDNDKEKEKDKEKDKDKDKEESLSHTL